MTSPPLTLCRSQPLPPDIGRDASATRPPRSSSLRSRHRRAPTSPVFLPILHTRYSILSIATRHPKTLPPPLHFCTGAPLRFAPLHCSSHPPAHWSSCPPIHLRPTGQLINRSTRTPPRLINQARRLVVVLSGPRVLRPSCPLTPPLPPILQTRYSILSSPP
jgi:hypothetical protein